MIMGADPVHAARQDTSQDPANSDKQAAKQDNPDQDKQKQENSPKQDTKDKKDATKAKGRPRVTITVVSDLQTPVKGAAVLLFGDSSQESKKTSADGKASFQARDGPMTLRILADHMEPYQKQLSEDQKSSGLRVVLIRAQ
jgi:hypothetical protein